MKFTGRVRKGRMKRYAKNGGAERRRFLHTFSDMAMAGTYPPVRTGETLTFQHTNVNVVLNINISTQVFIPQPCVIKLSQQRFVDTLGRVL